MKILLLEKERGEFGKTVCAGVKAVKKDPPQIFHRRS